jgi:hypothetical protein
MKKVCKKCLIEKEAEYFHKCSVNIDNLYNWCKKCKSEYDAAYRKTDKVLDYCNSQLYRDRKKEYRKYRFEVSLETQIFNQAKFRAKKYNLPFDIEIKDIIIPTYCPILNIKLERKPYGEGKSFQSSSPSLDKIEPSKGYIKGNIMVISMKANAMKSNATIDELNIFCKNYLKILKKLKKSDKNNIMYPNLE